MVEHSLMPIGRFARSCRLSVKALRHYDQLELLKPAFVDPKSGYRYYSPGQAKAAVMIGMLRSLDLPLSVIREALGAEDEDFQNIIQKETARIEAEVALRQAAVLSLRHIAKHGQPDTRLIEIREHAPREVLGVHGSSDAARLIPKTTELVRRLLGEMQELGIQSSEPILAINTFFDGKDAIGLQVCAPFRELAKDLDKSLVITQREMLAGGTFACLRHVGPYETLGLVHHAMYGWVQEFGHEAEGPIWEFYVNDPAETEPEQLITDIALPLRVAG